VWDSSTNELSCRGAKATVVPADGRLRLRELVDRCVLEVFANDGSAGLTFGGKIYSDSAPLKLEAGREVRVQSLRVSELKSAWPQP
jgi:sucrose-6-phosphate hydrolase SacC (GH32 family)